MNLNEDSPFLHKDERELIRLNEEELNRSPFKSLWEWKVQLGIFLVYGTIAGFLMYYGLDSLAYALAGVTLFVNSIYVVFKLVPMGFRWFVNLVIA